MFPASDLIALNVSPEVASNLSEGVLELVVSLSISKDEVTGLYLGAV